jgi:hypothetical protein
VVALTPLLVAATAREGRPIGLALAAALLLCADTESAFGRPALLAAALGLGSLVGLGSLALAYRAVVEAERAPEAVRVEQARDAASRAGWRDGVERAARAQAALLVQAGDRPAARAALERTPAPRQPATELALAQLEAETGAETASRFRLDRVASTTPGARAPLSPEAAARWGRALLRRDHPGDAQQAVAGLHTPEAGAVRAAATGKPDPDAPPCANARVGDAASARACLERSPGNAGALAALGQPVPPQRASQQLDERFAGTVRLRGVTPPPACVPRGGKAEIAWEWDVLAGFAPGEDIWTFVHADGPGRTLFFDHKLGGRTSSELIPGERIWDAVPISIPDDAPPGRYRLNLGLDDPATGLRLQPHSQPGHISFTLAGELEVCP